MVKFNFTPISFGTDNSKLELSISFVADEYPELKTFLEDTLGRECLEDENDSDRIVFSFAEHESIAILTVLDLIKEKFSSIYQEANADNYLDNNYLVIKKQQKQLLKDRKLSELSYTLSDDNRGDSVQVGSFKHNFVRRRKITEQESQAIQMGTTDVFHKTQPNFPDSRLAEYQPVAARLFQLLLGKDHAPTTRVVYDAIGIRQGTISAALENWQSLNEYFQEHVPNFPKTGYGINFNVKEYYPQEVVNKLVQDDIIAVFVVAHFLGETDRHSRNIGISNGKICVIDFDRTFWPLVEFFQGIAETSEKASFFETENIKSLAAERLPLFAHHIGEGFVNLAAEDMPWFDRYLFSRGSKDKDHDRSDYLAERIKKAPNYQEKLFFPLLRIITTPIEDLVACITPFIKNEKHKNAIETYVTERQQIYKKTCLENNGFRVWLLENRARLKKELNNQASTFDQLVEQAQDFCEESSYSTDYEDQEDSRNNSSDTLYLDTASPSRASFSDEVDSDDALSDSEESRSDSDDSDEDDSSDIAYPEKNTFSQSQRHTLWKSAPSSPKTMNTTPDEGKTLSHNCN